MSPSKTPQFDALLDPILNQLVPHTRECLWKGKNPHCTGTFGIEEGDIEFLRMLRVPPSNYCPTCRRMRRMVHMGVNRLFKRPCQAPGHNETVISSFSEQCPFPVYDYKYFISDEFDPFSYGRVYEGGSPLEFLFALRALFPMPSFLNRDPSCINSEYSSGGRNTKNAYYASGCYGSEDIWYSNMAGDSRSVMDSRLIHSSELVYGSLKCEHLYKTSFAYFSSNCSDCTFIFDCKNCSDCFGCVNVRNGRYQVFNQQLSKEEYEAFIASVMPLSRSMIAELSERFWALVKSLPMNASHNIGSSNVSGVGIEFSQDLYDCVEAKNCQHMRYVDSGLSHKDSMDVLFSGGYSHHLYGTINIGSHSSGVRFSVSSKFCTDCEFIFNSKNLTNCFMCFGLQNKSYCILNTQYSEDEYYKIVDIIKSEMLTRGEYSDPLGFEFAAQAYNFSLSAIPYPLSSEEIKVLGGYSADEPDTNATGITVLKASDVPDVIDAVSDDILEEAIACSATGRPFRIVSTELAFYRRMKLPIPVVHPSVRLEDQYRMAQHGKTYKTTCVHCGTIIDSMFDPNDGFVLYCETCFQREVV